MIIRSAYIGEILASLPNFYYNKIINLVLALQIRQEEYHEQKEDQKNL